MTRELAALTARSYDLVVVGGGIYGICAVREAARRGLSACLLERDDFAAATSANSLRIIHGGLRYLQHGDLRRMRQSIGERRLLQWLAPRLVRPLPCLMPTYGHGLKGPELLRIALALNDLVGFDRNRGLEPAEQLPRGETFSQSELLRLLPGVPREGLTGGALWYDCQVTSSERLALAFLQSGIAAGAVVANYVEMTDVRHADGRINGVRAVDRLTGAELEVQARAVLNATGPWVDQVLTRTGTRAGAPRFVPSKAFNLLLRRPLFERYAVGLAGRWKFEDRDAIVQKGAQLFFVVPWRTGCLVGTRHLRSAGPDDLDVTEADVARFLTEINEAYPAAELSRDDVLAVYSGLLPEAAGHMGAEVQLQKHPSFRDHREDGLDGLYTVVGVKWTTAREVASRTISRIAGRIAPAAAHPAPETAPLSGAEPDGPATPERVRRAVHDELAQRLSDVVFRRTTLGAGGHPGIDALERCADLVAAELGWSQTRRQAELADVEAEFHRRRSYPAARSSAVTTGVTLA
jgi:glycerol-3-phosphate dehydrogenase